MIIRRGSISVGSKSMNLYRTNDLYNSLFVHGTGMEINSKIESITDSTNILLNFSSRATTINVIYQFTYASVGTWLERINAQTDVYNIVKERGGLVEFIIRNEDKVIRGELESINKRLQSDSYKMPAYPIEYRPSRRSIEKAGLKEETEIMIHTASYAWDQVGIDFKDIDMERSTIKIGGDTYEIIDKALKDQFNDHYLYFVFGLNKK